MYGKPSAYGVVSKPMGTANGINSYFDGYIASENMRFRKNEYDIISLNTTEKISKSNKSLNNISYESSIIEYDRFELEICAGSVPIEGSITVIMGKNGTGKTSFINHIAKKIKDDTIVAYKPQYLSVNQFMEKDGSYPTVEDFLNNMIRTSFLNEMFRSDVVGPMEIDSIKDRHLNELSGGEMQRFWITYILGQDAQVYFLDEPSSCLDVEVRTNVTKTIKKFTMHNKKIIFVVEHDMTMAVGLGSEPNTQAIIVTEKNDSTVELKKTIVSCAVPFSTGINEFLKILNVTFRTQTTSKHNRPRINKIGSVKDREQKLNGIYYE
jgi:ATP-binding cassette subfamily E protein 1